MTITFTDEDLMYLDKQQDMQLSSIRQAIDEIKAKGNSTFYKKYSNAHLCRNHFIEDVERKIKRDIRKFKMIGKGEKIAVGLSGGKDSIVLLYVLHKIFKNRPDLEFMAITIDEGIKGYRAHTVEHATRFTGELGIKHIIRSFEYEFKTSLDALTREKENAAC